MKAYYKLTEALKEAIDQELTETITIGDIDKIDLSKRTIFPLAHIFPSSGSFNGSTISINVDIWFVDVVDYSQDNAKDQNDPYKGFNNVQDVLNTQMALANLLAQKAKRGSLWDSNIKLEDSPTFQITHDQFENLLFGVVLSMNVILNNDETLIC